MKINDQMFGGLFLSGHIYWTNRNKPYTPENYKTILVKFIYYDHLKKI